MSEFGTVGPAELPQILEDFANRKTRYRDGMLAGYAFTADQWPCDEMGESYLKFKVKRTRPMPGSSFVGVSYAVEEGVTEYVPDFPIEIMEVLGDDCNLDADDRLWVTTATSFAIAYDSDGTGVLLSTYDNRYGVDDAIVFDVPIVDGRQILSEEMAGCIVPTDVAQQDGLSLRELTLRGAHAAPAQAVMDDFEALVGNLVTRSSRIEECIQRIVGMLELLRED